MVRSSKEIETLDFSRATSASDEPRVVGLTLLCHPDPDRVGWVAALFSEQTGGVRRLSRLEPTFRSPTASGGHAIDSPLVSRKALVIVGDAEHGVRLRAEHPGLRVKLNGQNLTGEVIVSFASLEQGLVIELGSYVALLLHYVATTAGTRSTRLLGDSLAIRSVRDEIARVADTDTNVLIRGASGSGKELVAQDIHDGSRRAARPFVAVNMAAIPEAMAAAMLFGHARGAFTGALTKAEGFFRKANGGTLLLDEIGETPRPLQGALLRAIREGEIQPVGEASPVRVDVRVLSATDAPLEQLTEAGEFSLALLKRIDAYTITMPPLRDRRDDVARLFMSFLARELEQLGEARKLHHPATHKPFLTAEFVRCLVMYPFPGNVAELTHLAARVAIANRGRDEFHWDGYLTGLLNRAGTATEGHVNLSRPPEPGAESDPPGPGRSSTPRRRDPNSLQDAELVEAMRRCEFKPGEAAKRLGVSKAWMFARLESCSGIQLAKHLSEHTVRASGEACNWDVRQMATSLQVSVHGLRLRLNQMGIRRDSEREA